MHPKNLALILAASAMSASLWACGKHESPGAAAAVEKVPVVTGLPLVLAAPAAAPTTKLSADAMNGITRVKTPDGGELVTALKVPKTLRDPHGMPGFAYGDWLIENLGSEPRVITPFLDKDAYGSEVQAPVLESLLTRDQETFEWQPWLAESYELKPDHVTVVYKIRKEATFSDGSPVTADDVLFSFNTMMDPKIDDDRYRTSGPDKIKECRKIDDRTVEYIFREPFFQELEVSGSIPIIPQRIYHYDNPDEYNKLTDKLVGSGPYVFSQWQRGQRIILKRNDKYWGPKAPVDQLQFVFIQNPSAAFQAFQNGDIDDFSPDPEQYHKFADDDAFKSKYTIYKFDRPNSGYTYIGWNEKSALFADAKTRRALTMLVDRETMIDTLIYGLAHSITGPFSFMTPQNDPSIEPLPFDPRAARALLTEAGWKLNDQNVLVRNGQEFRFKLSIPADLPISQKVAEEVKKQFAKAGIIMTIDPLEFSVLVDHLDERKFDASMLGWTGTVEDDPYQIWHSDNIKGKGSNYISWSNKDADALIEAGRKELDETKRMEIWHKLHRIIADEQPYTFMWISSARVFIQKRFENTAPYKLGTNSYDWFVPTGQQKYH